MYQGFEAYFIYTLGILLSFYITLKIKIYIYKYI